MGPILPILGYWAILLGLLEVQERQTSRKTGLVLGRSSSRFTPSSQAAWGVIGFRARSCHVQSVQGTHIGGFWSQSSYLSWVLGPESLKILGTWTLWGNFFSGRVAVLRQPVSPKLRCRSHFWHAGKLIATLCLPLPADCWAEI